MLGVLKTTIPRTILPADCTGKESKIDQKRCKEKGLKTIEPIQYY
jgi:hypothetical protein